MNLNKLKKLKVLGSGFYGTTYLVVINKKKYALKIQHVLPVYKIKNYKYEIWREIDLFNYVENLKDKDRKFFLRLHKYEFHDNCKHIQKRPYKLGHNYKLAKSIKKLDNSKVCCFFLTDYLGKWSLQDFIAKKSFSFDLTFSFILQLLNIINILSKGGYYHGDLHPANIMVIKTNEK